MDSNELVDLKVSIPDISDLSFNLEGSVIFTKAPFEENLYLQNHNHSQEMRFFLQSHPADTFHTSPSFGTLKPGQSMMIKIKFIGNVNCAMKSISGFIRIRNENGFPMER